MILYFSLPLVPKSKKNSRPIYKTKAGKMFIGKSKQLVEHARELEHRIRSQKINFYSLGVPIAGPVRLIDVNFYFKGKQRLDLDNMLATLFDALQDAEVIKNDKQIIGISQVTVIENNKTGDATTFGLEALN